MTNQATSAMVICVIGANHAPTMKTKQIRRQRREEEKKKRRTSNLKVGLGRKEEGRKERIERKKTGKKTKRSTKKQKESKLSHIVIRGLEHRGDLYQ